MKRISHVGVAFAVLLVAPSTLLSGAEKGSKSSEKDQEQGTVHTVQAGVGYPTNAGVGIQAEKQPGSFTIPKGSQGAKLKYSFADPKSDYTSTKLRGSNIYSVTEKRYMHELDHNPDFELPPGEYKFVVGSLPGASGSLVYTVVPGSDVKPPPGGKPQPPTIRRPQPPSDTTKTGVKPDPLHPGGEGKKRVIIKFKAGEIPANLTIQGKKFILDVDLGPLPKYTTSAIQRWEGTLESNGGSVSAKGTIIISYAVTDDQGRQGYAKCTGNFTGTLNGKVLRGHSTISGHDKAPQGEPKPVNVQDDYSIDGFGP